MRKLLALLIAIALAYGLFRELRLSAFPRLEDGNNLPMYMVYSQSYATNTWEIPANWKSRAVSCDVAGWWFDLWGQPKQAVFDASKDPDRAVYWRPSLQNKNCDMLASYHAVFYLLTCCLLIAFVENPVFAMLGIFASILVCSPAFFCPYLMPWDLPTMTLWALIFLLYERLRRNPAHPAKWLGLAALITLGGLFKETVLVEALFLLAAPWPLIRRLGLIALIVVVSQILNWFVTGATPDWLFSVHGTNVPGQPHWDPLALWPVLFANAGAVTLLPWLLYRRRDWALAAVCGAFIVLNAAGFMNTGYFDELRDWLDIAPIGWLLIGELLLTPPTVPASAETKPPAARKKD